MARAAQAPSGVARSEPLGVSPLQHGCRKVNPGQSCTSRSGRSSLSMVLFSTDQARSGGVLAGRSSGLQRSEAGLRIRRR